MSRAALSRLCWLTGGVSVGILGWAGFVNIKTTLQSYLFSFLFWSDLPLGALALLMVHGLTGGDWGLTTQPILKRITSTLPLVGLFAIPVLLGLKWIYPWMDPQIALEPKILHKHSYLNSMAFTLRTLGYFGVWLVFESWVRKADSTRLGKISAGGLVVLGFTVTFASIDWQMSVEPLWYSTIYGMVFLIGQALSAYAFCLWIGRGFAIIPTEKTRRDLGNLLLTLVMVWAYLSFMQYLIVWSGNLPEEVTWYNRRIQNGWQWCAGFLFLFQFTAPFVLLLFRSFKSQAQAMSVLGGFIFLIRALDHYWMLIPGLNTPEQPGFHWQAGVSWLALGGLWMGYFLREERSL